MKNTLTIFAMLLVFAATSAQGPEKISYQAVIRNSSGQLLTNQLIGLQISIIQGTIYGASVYVETQQPTTNANGLASVEIGGGTPVFGSFSAIDWSNGPYFIKNETDPSGGTAYSITGISQILSVPYALHAREADQLTGQITESQISDLKNYLTSESDPVFAASPAHTITGGSIADWNASYGWGNHALAGYVPGTRSLSINGQVMDLAANRSWNTGTVTSITTNNGITGGPISTSGTIGLTGQALALHNLAGTGLIARAGHSSIVARSIIAGNGIKVAYGDGSRGDPVISAQTWEVGNFAHGGIVFWVDDTGQHGLVCWKSDLAELEWSPGNSGSTRAKGNGPGAGYLNTAIIIAAHAALGDDGSNYAARSCNEANLSQGGSTYGDWYLPSVDELSLMYQNRVKINATAIANGGQAFSSVNYWSSTEGTTMAFALNFSNGSSVNTYKSHKYKIRPVRAF